MGKWNNRSENKVISEVVISDLSTEKLQEAKTFIESFLHYKKLSKLRKTYVDGVKKAITINEEDNIYFQLNLDGTKTGRLSCGAYSNKGVSFHTLPREKENNVRNIFCAPPGWKFITSDYSTMELRVLAHISNSDSMVKAFNSGIDLHTYTAQLLFKKKDISKKERQIAKTISFLIVYGGKAFNLSETANIPLHEAETIITKYSKLYPEVFSYMEEVESFIKQNKYIESIFGRRRHLSNIDSPNKGVVLECIRQGLNFSVQSPASDILLISMISLCDTLESKYGKDARVVCTVHDSIEIICKEELEKEVIQDIRYELINYPKVTEIFGIKFNVPFEIEIDSGTSFGNGTPVNIHT